MVRGCVGGREEGEDSVLNEEGRKAGSGSAASRVDCARGIVRGISSAVLVVACRAVSEYLELMSTSHVGLSVG